MSFSRLKNIYTLGSPQRYLLDQSRRAKLDVFEKDPFKVQSFNFHYAERPRSSPYSKSFSKTKETTTNNNGKSSTYYSPSCDSDKRFDTYFMNKNFSKKGKENETYSNKFSENRRRKFVQEYRNPFRTPMTNASKNDSYAKFTPTISPFLKSVCNQSDMYKKLQPHPSRSSMASTGSLNSSRSVCGLVYNNKQSNPLPSVFKIPLGKSVPLDDKSVCKININIIRSHDENNPNGNFKIEIETEKKDEGINVRKSQSSDVKSNLDTQRSKRSLIGSKNLSNLSMQGNWSRNTLRSLPNTGSSVSSTGRLLSKASSSNRVPGVMPWRSGSSNCVNQNKPKNLFNNFGNRSALPRTNSLYPLNNFSNRNPRRLNSFTNIQNNLSRPTNPWLLNTCPLNLNLRANHVNNITENTRTDLQQNKLNDLNIVRPKRKDFCADSLMNIFDNRKSRALSYY